ncbi:hypothetical protein BDQ12DRAFT_675781 [Crucibulum laeve]|uniref:BTB domain-containing protein n=1 Tax=Crucibulum laeve TaxID=68775 RepID=A0A5C3MRI2_9AGAR|nr:hypothetical protein BDQ12DRAFT_675781 [Crucibulum laeve]
MLNTHLGETVRKYHPRFDSPHAKVILRSREGTLYRTSAFTLRNTSGYFRNLLPPAQHQTQTTHQQENPILIDASDTTLELVLRMLCGLETAIWTATFDELEDAVVLIERWDTAGPLSIIRSAITAPPFHAESLRLYALATRLGWEEEAQLASTHTLSLSLHDEDHTPRLEQLKSKHLLSLSRLHRSRRDMFKHALDTHVTFSHANSPRTICQRCQLQEIDNYPWRELKMRMFMEMDRRPLGDTIGSLDMEEWAESVVCWGARCPKEQCSGLYYDKRVMMRSIMSCLVGLPLTV